MSYHTHSPFQTCMYFFHISVEQNRRFKNIGGHTHWTQWLLQIKNQFFLFLCSTEERNAYSFANNMRVNYDRNFILWELSLYVMKSNCNCMILRSVFVCSLRWWLYKALVVIVYSCSRKRHWISHLRGTEFPPWSNSIKY